MWPYIGGSKKLGHWAPHLWGWRVWCTGLVENFTPRYGMVIVQNLVTLYHVGIHRDYPEKLGHCSPTSLEYNIEHG